MPVNVRVPGPLRRLTAGSAQVEVDGATVSQALADLEARYPGFRERLYDDDGNLRRFINIYVNDTDIRFGGGLETMITDRDDISIVPAVAGGLPRPGSDAG
jgi:molybdopterin synthase sulfur carrier subunit